VGNVASDEQIGQGGPQRIEHENPIREVGFAQIEHVVTLDLELSDGAFRTYALLHYFWRDKKQMWASTATLAAMRGVKEATILAHLRELIAAGLIERRRRLGQSSIICLKDLPERYLSIAQHLIIERDEASQTLEKTEDKLEKKLNFKFRKNPTLCLVKTADRKINKEKEAREKETEEKELKYKQIKTAHKENVHLDREEHIRSIVQRIIGDMGPEAERQFANALKERHRGE